MQLFRFYYDNILRQEFLTKFIFVNCLQIPHIEKVVLRFNVNHMSLRSLLPSITGLFLISSQKPLLVSRKRQHIVLKFQSGVAVSCKVDLRNMEKYYFLEQFVYFFLPRILEIKYTLQKTSVSFLIDNIFLFKEIEKDFEYFPELPKLTVDFFFKVKTSSELFLFLNALKLPQ